MPARQASNRLPCPLLPSHWGHVLCPVHFFSESAGYFNCEWQLYIRNKRSGAFAALRNSGGGCVITGTSHSSSMHRCPTCLLISQCNVTLRCMGLHDCCRLCCDGCSRAYIGETLLEMMACIVGVGRGRLRVCAGHAAARGCDL